MRAETGYMQFEGDWRGIFIRGDTAMRLAADLDLLGISTDKPESGTQHALHRIKNLCELLHGVDQNGSFLAKKVQLLKNIADCQKDG